MPMCGTGDHDHSQVPDLQVANAVLNSDADHIVLSCHAFGALGEGGGRTGVITVVERLDIAPLIAAAYDAEKDANTTDLRR